MPVRCRCRGAALFIGELSLIAAVDGAARCRPFPVLRRSRTSSTCARLLALTARYRWPFVALGAVGAGAGWRFCSGRRALTSTRRGPGSWCSSAALYAVFAAYPFVARPAGRATAAIRTSPRCSRSAIAFFGARAAFVAGGLDWMVGVVPVSRAPVLAALLRSLLSLEPAAQRDLGRLALVAGAALAFVTVAIPLQLKQQWITIGWALEGAALAWLYRASRIAACSIRASRCSARSSSGSR